MQIVESYLDRTPIYKKQELFQPKGIILYTVGCPQPSAKVLIHNWNQEKFEGFCPHALIDARSGNCFTLLPWNVKGSHTKNEIDDECIGVVMCEPSAIKYTKKDNFKIFNQASATDAMRKTLDSAVDMCALLCAAYSIAPETGIFSLKERPGKINTLSRFKDPEHFWVGLNSNLTMDAFRGLVKEKMEVLCKAVMDTAEQSMLLAPQSETEVLETPNDLEKIRISVSNLRIRTGPGKDNATTGEFTGIGDFEISERQNGSGSEKGWAKLADGRGWVSLDYAELL